MKRLSAFLVRHGRWVMAAGLTLIVAAGVTGNVSPAVAGLLAFAALVLFVGGLFIAGLVSEHVMRTDDDGGADDAYFGAVAAGQPLSRTALRDTRRDLALSSRRAEARAKVSSIARHYRRHGSDS